MDTLAATAGSAAAVIHAQVDAMDAVAAHAATPTGAREVADLRREAEQRGDRVTADFLASAENVAARLNEAHEAVQAAVPIDQRNPSPIESTPDWDPGTPATDVAEHWSIAEGGSRWHEGGCGAFAIAMVERWPHLKIATEMYHDRGAESVAHAWAYDPATATRFHIFGAEPWKPTSRPDYDPDSHRVLLDQSPEDVRRLFRGFNTSEDAVYDAMEVACEMFDPDYEAPEDDGFGRQHLYFW